MIAFELQTLSLAWIPAGPSEWGAVVLSYLLGAVPFGFVLGKLRGVDIRSGGSGNIGATNAGRMLGKPFAYLAFVGDCAKGWVPYAWIGPWLASDGASATEMTQLSLLCGLAAVAGHVWPVYLGFKGGKAVATSAGMIVAIDPVIILGAGLVWLALFFSLRWVSVASLGMSLSFPLFAAWRSSGGKYGTEVVWGTFALALLIVWRHAPNLKRLLQGTEPKMGRKR